MFGEEAIKIAKELDVTPVSARRLMQVRDVYILVDKAITYLNPSNGLDSRIIDAMGWLPGGMGYRSKIIIPPSPVMGGGFRKV